MTTRKLGSIKLTDNVLVPNVALGSEVTGILGVANGGTGQSVYTDGQLLIGNTTGNTLNKATLTAGTGITITNGAGAITIATSIIGSQWLNSGSNIYFSSGNVAIGTTPSASIELLLRGAGATNATFSLSTENSAATNTFYVRDDGAVAIPNGNLGIGTSPTAQRLQVNGTTTISGQLTLSQASGTAPMVVTSTTRVANLNVATAGTADQLTTARTINGVSFNGTANITVAAAAGTLTGTTLASGVTASSLTSVGTLTSLAVSGNASVGPISSGADGLNVAVTRNLTFGEGSSNSYLNLFRQANSGGTVLANGYKYSATADGFASSTSVAWAKSAIRLANGDIQFYADASTTVANGTDATPSPRVIIGRAGRVGIGTTNPATLLDVTGGFGTSTTAFTIYNNTAFNAANIAQIDFRVNNSFGGNERVASITALNPNAAANNGGALVFSVSANGTATTPTEDMRIDAAGNVGIGTTSPTFSLDISSALADQLRTTSSGTISNFYQTTSSGTTVLQNTSGAMAFYTGGSERARITSTGNVGIGTTNPGLKVDVIGRLRFRSDGASSAGFWLTDNAGTTDVFTGLHNVGSTDTWGVYSAGAWRFNVTNAGNVGIGTTSNIDGSKLDVRNGKIVAGTSASTDGSVTIQNYYSSGALSLWGSMYSSGGPLMGYGVKSSTTTANSFLSATGINISRGAYIIEGNVHRWYNGATQTVAIDSAVTMAERMTMDANGNVGIGTTSPGNYRLNVSKGAAGDVAQFTDGVAHTFLVRTDASTLFVGQANNFPLVLVTNNTEKVRITAAGDVGIGTTSPGARLHVSAVSTNNVLRLERTGTSAGGGFIYANVNETFGVTDGTLYPFLVKQGAPTESLVVASSGNVGIGTTSPVVFSNQTSVTVNGTNTGRFDIQQGGTHRAALIATSTLVDLTAISNIPLSFGTNSAERMRITGAGDVFVGTTSSWSSARFVSERNSTSVPAAEFNGTGQTAGLAPVYIWNNAESGSTYFISFYSDGVNNPRTLRGYINYRRDNATMNLTTASDYRIKTIHGAYTKSGEVFDKIQVHEGTINGESGKYPMVLAHELQEAYSPAVEGEKDAVNEDGTPKLQMVSYVAMIPVMLAEIKSLRARVAALES